MREITGNLFDQTNADAICIPTNGYVKKNGYAVMGAGVALDACKRWPGIDDSLGILLYNMGNRPFLLTSSHPDEPEAIYIKKTLVPYHVLTFPTKPKNSGPKYSPHEVLSKYQYKAKEPNSDYWSSFRPMLPGFMMKARIGIIKRSANAIVDIANLYGWKSVALPMVGAGNEEMEWESVKYVLETILDDRFYIVKKF
jgi:hypothetical protein